MEKEKINSSTSSLPSYTKPSTLHSIYSKSSSLPNYGQSNYGQPNTTNLYRTTKQEDLSTKFSWKQGTSTYVNNTSSSNNSISFLNSEKRPKM